MRRAAPTKPAVDPDVMLVEVEDFVELARSGAYLGRSRRVSPQERTRWRFTFKRLVTEAHDALSAEDPAPAIAALGQLIDLAMATESHDYFRSQDPIAAAGFVVSDAAAAMWGRLVDVAGFRMFSETAAPQLLQWERRHGWTRTGDNATAAKETALAAVLSRMLRTADDWERFGAQYLRALDASRH